MVDLPPGSAALAVLSEQRLFGNVTALARDHSVGMGKALLVRPTTQAWPAVRTVRLVPTITESDWQVYIEQRIGVEAEFGVDERRARSMVRDLRDRSIALGLDVYTASTPARSSVRSRDSAYLHRTITSHACRRSTSFHLGEHAGMAMLCCTQCSGSSTTRAARW